MILNKPFIILIQCYRKFISPLMAPRCKYYPSCSEYSLQCFQSLPLYKAVFYSTKRIISCNPWSAGGNDPMPKCDSN